MFQGSIEVAESRSPKTVREHPFSARPWARLMSTLVDGQYPEKHSAYTTKGALEIYESRLRRTQAPKTLSCSSNVKKNSIEKSLHFLFHTTMVS